LEEPQLSQQVPGIFRSQLTCQAAGGPSSRQHQRWRPALFLWALIWFWSVAAKHKHYSGFPSETNISIDAHKNL